MKMLQFNSSIALLAALTPFTLHAQTDQIVGGYAVFSFTPAFQQQLSSFGATLTDLSLNALPNGANTLPSVEGIIDSRNGNGDLVFKGGYQIAFPGTVLRIEDLVFDIKGAAASFSGILILNGTVKGRQQLFVVNQKPNFILPLPVQNGALSLPQISLGLAPGFISLVNQASGQAVLNGNTQIGTASAFPAIVPDALSPVK